MLDTYFKRPVFYDYIVSMTTAGILYVLFTLNQISLPNMHDSFALTGDLTNIALTMAGFILTILTILITFKDSSSQKTTDVDAPTFNKFFGTEFYYKTVLHLKNCLKSIVIIATIGFAVRLFLTNDYKLYFFFYNVLGLIVTILTVWRCMLILSKILVMQK